MSANAWTREDNEQFKTALQLFTAFSFTRFESIAEYLQKPLTDVKEHYEELVNALLEIGSSQVAFPDDVTEAMTQSLCQVEKTVWNKEEHEWFLIGLKRFGKDWENIAVLLNSKNPMQVAIYAHNYFQWQIAKKNVMKQSRDDNDMTLVESTGQQESLDRPQSQSQQEPMVLEIRQLANVSDSKSY